MPQRVSQSPGFVALFVLWCVGVGVCVRSALLHPEPDLRHPAVIGSAAITVGWMLLAWAAMLMRAAPFARLAWTLGWLMVLVHFVLAFGMAHGWSYPATVDHIQEVGGYREGIWVNYLFAAVWGLDVVWWWANPTGYASRSRWTEWAINGFLLFVVVNATVVFGPPERRLWYAAVLAGLALVWASRRFKPLVRGEA